MVQRAPARKLKADIGPKFVSQLGAAIEELFEERKIPLSSVVLNLLELTRGLGKIGTIVLHLITGRSGNVQTWQIQ